MGKRIPIILGLILIALSVWLQVTSKPIAQHWLEQVENTAYDFQLRTRLATHKNIDPKNTSVAIIDIDDKSLRAEGRWPWSREKLGTLVRNLKADGVVVVAFDVIFPEDEDNIATIVLEELNKRKLLPPDQISSILTKIAPYFDADKQFSESLQQLDNVLAITFTPRKETEGSIGAPLLLLSTPADKSLAFFTLKGFISNIPILQQAAKSTGFINVFADEDGVIRRVPLLIRYKDGLYPSLALEAVRLYLLSDIKLVTARYGETKRLEGIQIGDYVIPTDAYSQVVIPFRGRSYTFPYYSATDVLKKKTPLGTFSGKIVFIGTTAVGLGDLKATAIQNIFPGVEVQASIADGILKNNFPHKPDWALGAELFSTVFLGLLFTFIFPFLGPRFLILLAVIIPTILLFFNNWLWEKTGFLLSILIPLLLVISIAMMNIIYGYFFEVRRRKRLREMFGQYVPEKHIDEMLHAQGSYALYGEDREMTVLFSDIRGFTTISEKLSATQIKTLLNQIFTPMTEIIFKHHGTIDKYVGDLIMSFWGAPLKDNSHARHAIMAALDMQKKLTELNTEFASQGWPLIEMGIGLNSGIMSVGDMGSKFRRNYTVLGDAVNLASRVEALTAHYGVNIIITENSKKNQTLFLCRQLDRVRVKGKKEGIQLYEVLSLIETATETQKEEVALSEAALTHYYQQQWNLAHELFSKLSAMYPQAKLYQIYLERIKVFEQTPPPADWDGVYTHTTK